MIMNPEQFLTYKSLFPVQTTPTTSQGTGQGYPEHVSQGPGRHSGSGRKTAHIDGTCLKGGDLIGQDA